MVKDILQALKSKRVIVAVITAAAVAVNQELALVDAETLTKVVALAAALILGDSLRAINPDKENATETV